jgi:hypothetical protein
MQFFARPAVEVDVVGGFVLALDAGAEELQLALDVLLRRVGHTRGDEVAFQFFELSGLGVGFFQDHGMGRSISLLLRHDDAGIEFTGAWMLSE